MAEGGPIIEGNGEFPCLICGQKGLTESEMRQHIMSEHVESEVCCPFCDLSSITENEMTLHVNQAHLNEYFLPDKDDEEGEDECRNEVDMKTSRTRACDKSQHDEMKENKGVTIKKSESADKSKLTLDICSSESAGVLRMSPSFKCNNLNVGLSTSIGAVQRGISLPSLRRPAPPIVIPDINDNVEPDINCNIPGEFTCPLCQFSTISEADIQTHVNRDHMDILSPCKGDREECGNRCPLCKAVLPSAEELQIHVNRNHSDILSPAHPHSSKSMDDADIMSWENIVTCPVCDQEFDDAAILQIHVNGHFSAEQTPVLEATDHILAEELYKSEEDERIREQREFHALQAMYGMTGSSNYKKQYERNLEKALTKGELTISEYHMHRQNMKGRELNGVDDGHSVTKGVMDCLAAYYKNRPSNILEVHLANHVDHYCGSYGDKGWGCGYRNFQMLLSSMAANPTFCKILFNGKPQIPSIPKIQRLIEAAWDKGFDRQGSEQLGGKVMDTTKWIGATEIAATLLSLRVKCKLLDFHSPSGPDGTHPKLFQWIKEYFQQPLPYILPLYLQHQGHSRTVVGIEEMRDGSIRLLIFDPSTSKKQMQQFHGVINSNIIRTIRRTIHGLKAKQYQIVAVVGVLEEKEYEEHKILRSERVN